MNAASVMPGGLKELSTDDPSLLREKFKPIDKTSLSEEISRQIMNLVSSAPSQKLVFLRRQLQMRERLRDKARFCVRRAITPNTDDWTRFWLPPPLMPLYYVLRPIRLAGKYALSPVKRIFAPT